MFSTFKQALSNIFAGKLALPKDDPAVLAGDLYKRNIELGVKNKTLSLLSKLYELSILALEPNDMAQRVTREIQVDLVFEIVGILVYNHEKNSLHPLAFANSDRLAAVESKFKTPFSNISLSNTRTGNSLLQSVVKSGKMVGTENLSEIWPSEMSASMISEVITLGHVKSTLVYPLMSGGKIIGILVISLNRPYDKLLEYEKDSINSFINVVAVALDKALLYKQLQELNVRLKELDQLKTEFLSFASHQLRSPLTAIRGYASLILEGTYGKVTKKIQEPIDRIFQSSNALAVMVDDFLNISKIEQGGMKYDFQMTDFKKLVETVVAEQEPNIKAKKLTTTFNIQEGINYNLKIDAGKIKQVIMNLVDNSVKYTPAGSITLSLKQVDHKFQLEIKDTGIGFNKETLSKLFGKFSREKNANKVNIQGSGLGLYLAKQIVEAHHGHIWAQSPGEGKGASFFVEFYTDLIIGS